jgi:uncharacterized protein
MEKANTMSSSKGNVIVIAFLRFYQRFLSPMFPPVCRFTPTCSEYMLQAVSRYGAGRGVFMGVKRILRCHPFSKGGHDPVQ